MQTKQLMSASVMRKNREFHRGNCRKICLSFMWIYLFFYPNPPDSSRSFYLLCNEIVKLKIFVSFIRTIIHYYVANGDLKNKSFLRKNFINFHLLNVFLQRTNFKVRFAINGEKNRWSGNMFIRKQNSFPTVGGLCKIC